MTQKEAEILHRAMSKMIDECDVDATQYQSEIMEGYSGRGMYGKETYALVLKSLAALLQAMMTFPELLYDDENNPIATHQIISQLQTDQLGHSIILY